MSSPEQPVNSFQVFDLQGGTAYFYHIVKQWHVEWVKQFTKLIFGVTINLHTLNMYIRLLAFDSRLSTWRSQQQRSSWKVIPRSFNHYQLSIPVINGGKGLVVFPYTSISHVFGIQWHPAIQCPILGVFDFTDAESLLSLTGTPTVMSSANLTSKLL